ncbi:MAG: hypothetical protein J6R96_02550, partial [Spirochaetaceae bacterium]|nr:hypothetical protein [Spirochaetaceae bacterium]
MAKKLKVLLNILSFMYPAVVFLLLVVLKLPVRVFSLFILVLLVGYVSISAIKNKQEKRRFERKMA